MRSNYHIATILSMAATTAAGLACGLSSVVPSIPGISAEVPAADARLLADDFSDSDSGWGTGTDSDSAVEYEGGVLRMKAFRDYFFTWSTPDDQDYDAVHIEVTANNESGVTRLGFGVICDQQIVDSSFHYLAVTTDGEYAIARAEIGKDDVFLTNNDDWATSDVIAVGAPSYRVGADCKQGVLTLYVDGKEVDSVTDPTFIQGGVGLFLWSAEEASGTISYDDFVMTKAK